MKQIHASEPTHAFGYALFDNAIKANKCSTEYEQNIWCIYVINVGLRWI